METFLQALLLGVLEGLTEFLPVSSTGHLILASQALGFDLESDAIKTFIISIQLGAILAVCVVYRRRLWGAATGLATSAEARGFVRNILIAFAPAMVIGALAYKQIKALLESPVTVAVMLIVGGLLIIWIERRNRNPRHHAVERFPALLAFKIGLFQCLAMVPGVSRSGATIMGSLLVGVDRKAAAEFSFFLAIPTMIAATVYSLYKSRESLDFGNVELIAAGFIAAFVTAMIVIKAAIAFISRHGFAPFAWYRIVVGSAMLAMLLTR